MLPITNNNYSLAEFYNCFARITKSACNFKIIYNTKDILFYFYYPFSKQISKWSIEFNLFDNKAINILRIYIYTFTGTFYYGHLLRPLKNFPI